MNTPTLKYTKAQQDAIDRLDGNVQVIACAGSGKTQVLAQRIVNLLKNRAAEGLVPANIVAFTFTEKAAGELKDRIYTLYRAQIGDVTMPRPGFREFAVPTVRVLLWPELDFESTEQPALGIR